jgi:hypothetical protein
VADAGVGGDVGKADAGVDELSDVRADGLGIGVGMPSAIGDGAPTCLLNRTVSALAGGAPAAILRVGGSGAVSVSVAAVMMSATGDLVG